MKKNLGLLLRVSVSLSALAGLIFFLRNKLGASLGIIQEGLQWEWFSLALAVYLVGVVLLSWRLQLVFRMQGVKVGLFKAIYLSFLGYFFSLFFPSAMGGDVAKAYFAYQYSGKKMASLTGVVLDRLLGFVTLVGMALVVFTAYGHSVASPMVKRALYGGLGLLILGTVFFSSPRFAQKFQWFSFLIPSAKWRQNLTDLYHAIRNCQDYKRALGASLVISMVAQSVFFVNAFLLAKSLGNGIAFWPFFVLMPLVVFVSLAPSLSGLGVREAGFVFFFKALMPAEQAFALSLLYDFIFYGVALLAGLVFAFKGGLRKEIIQDLKHTEVLKEVGK